MATIAVVSNWPDQSPLGSPQRAVIDAANAGTLFDLNRIYTSGAIGIAGTVTKVRTSATVAFTIGGQFQTAVVSTDNVWTLGTATSGTTVQPSSYQKYLMCWDATGASGVAVFEGTQSTVSAAAVTFKNINNVSVWGPIISVLNTPYVIVGVLTVATDTTAGGFIPGTTALDAASVTDTYVNGIDPYLLPVIGNRTGMILGSGT